MLKNILKFYIKEGIGFSFSEKPISYLKTSTSSFDEELLSEKKSKSNEAITPVKRNLESLQQRKNFATNKNIKEAEKLASKSSNLNELYNNIKAFDGCDLKVLASKAVMGDGISKNPRVMVIGEAPSRDDDRNGIPFSGDEGVLLDKMLKSIGLSRKDNTYLSNIINWWPPGNRPTTQEEVDVSLPFIKRHIEIVNPDLILTLGGRATQHLLNTKDTLNKTHGKEFEYKFSNIDGIEKTVNLVPIFTPDFIINNPKMKPVIWKDLLFIKELMESSK